jgi:hypothetical protein
MSIITVSSEDPTFPKENLIDGDYSAPFRFNSLTGGTIEIDFLTAVIFDTVFIGNHNFDPTAAVTIKVGDVSPPTLLVASPGFREKNIVAALSTQSFRFLEVGIADANSSLTQIGELVVGVRSVLPRGIRFGFRPGIQQEVIQERTNRGKRYALELFELERREYSFRFPESERAQFLAFWKSVSGSIDPFVWIENDSQADPIESLFVSIETAGFDPQEDSEPASDPVFDWSVTLIEEGLGGEIAL